MKKNLLKIFSFGLVLTSLFFVTGCQNNANSETIDEDEDVKNKLSESSGINEVSGKTYASSSNNSKVVFDDSSLTIYDTSSLESANLIRRATSSSDKKYSTYNYSYNSEDKTLELQLAKLWDSNEAAITYKNQVETVKTTLKNLASLIQAQFDTSKNDIYKTFIESLNKIDVANGTYGNTIATLITNKLDAYITKQESILDDYLQKKYNSTVKFSYDNSNSKLALTQQFKNDLNDASSEFTSSDAYKVILNGYDSLKPFSITLTSGEKSQEYVGVPSFSDGTMSVDLYEFIGANILDDDFDATTLATTKATELLTYVNDKLKSINSDTTTASSPKVTLTTTRDFSTKDGTYSLANGTKIELSYYPILSSTIQVSDLTLQE